MYDHASTTVALSTGAIVILKEGKEHKGFVHGGFAEIKEDQVILLPDAAEWPEEIDIERAKRAKEKALKVLESRHINEMDEETIRLAQEKKARAETRLMVQEWFDHN